MTDTITEIPATLIRNRIVETKKMRLGDILGHPMNPKYHPAEQRNLVGDLMMEVGWLGGVKAYYSERNGGKLTLLDAHLRKNIAPDLEVDVEITDLDDREADLMVALYDESGRLSQINPEVLDDLLRGIDTTNETFQAALAEMASRGELYGEDPGETQDDTAGERSDGSLLKLMEITIAEPRNQVTNGDIWHMGDHILVCADVLTGWPIWIKYLDDPDAIFAPFPGPMIPLCEKAMNHKFIMVQPDPYIAGHILDRYEDIAGQGVVWRD